VFILFLIAVSLQVIFFIVFLVALFRKESEHEADSQALSVIVCAHDEEQNLRELIPLLLNQQHECFEVIIVNDRSNDGTYDFLLAETKKEARLKMVHIEKKPDHVNAKKYALTLGIKAAQFDWVVLTDADCRPHSTLWLSSLNAKMSDQTDIVLGYSPYLKTSGILNLFIRYETLFTALQYFALALLGKPYMGVGRNLAYRKSLFLSNKGFGDFIGVTGGDDDLFVNRHATKTNTRVCTGEPSLVYSIPKQTVHDFFWQKVRHLSVGKKYRASHQTLLAVFSVSLLCVWLVAVPMMISGVYPEWVAGLFNLRLALLSVAIHQASVRFGHKFEWWAVLLLDFLFVIYYLSTVPVALLTKKLRWKN
jgi:glycosyltransferase involved in cell wall biosynthesis